MNGRHTKCRLRGHDLTIDGALEERGTCVECRRIRDRKRKQQRAATHCSRGHMRTAANTRIATRPNGVVMRTCRICHRDGMNRASRAKNPNPVAKQPRSIARDLTNELLALYDQRERAAMSWERQALTARIELLQRVRPA